MSAADLEPLPPPPRNLRMVIEYDGTAYAGWEKQKNGVGIQQLLQGAIRQITGEDTSVNGAGRTDAGVHALGQVASFTLQKRMPAVDLHRALNAVLPDDVAVLALEDVSLYFHARFSATGKIYRYLILNEPVRAPLLARTSHHVRSPLDLDAMRAAARELEGRHDFAAFARDVEPGDETVRTIWAIDVEREGRCVAIYVAGDGFLYNMVRIIAGTLAHVGVGKISSADMPGVLASQKRSSSGPTLPARGLALLRVFYGGRPSARPKDSCREIATP
jgi:tRNA pseudouridine38-40 synthase